MCVCVCASSHDQGSSRSTSNERIACLLLHLLLRLLCFKPFAHRLYRVFQLLQSSVSLSGLFPVQRLPDAHSLFQSRRRRHRLCQLLLSLIVSSEEKVALDDACEAGKMSTVIPCCHCAIVTCHVCEVPSSGSLTCHAPSLFVSMSPPLLLLLTLENFHAHTHTHIASSVRMMSTLLLFLRAFSFLPLSDFRLNARHLSGGSSVIER